MIIEVMYDLRFLRFRDMVGIPIPIPDLGILLFSMPIILDDSHQEESLRIKVLCVI
jgi:hypothetical protein